MLGILHGRQTRSGRALFFWACKQTSHALCLPSGTLPSTLVILALHVILINLLSCFIAILKITRRIISTLRESEWGFPSLRILKSYATMRTDADIQVDQAMTCRTSREISLNLFFFGITSSATRVLLHCGASTITTLILGYPSILNL